MSYRAKLFSFILVVLKIKKRSIKNISNPFRNKKGFTPYKYLKAFKINKFTIDSKAVVTLENKNKSSNTHIIFFHGGGYVFEASILHWKFVKNIIKLSSCKITVIDYPLAPENNFKNTFQMISKSYDKLVDKYSTDNFILMGDSAGGGLAFALAQKLKKENHKKLPFKNILLSPWLDMTLSNPKIEEIKDLDKMLNIDMLHSCAKKYSAGHSLDYYLLSPINGDFEGVNKTIIFYGTSEIIYPDCLKLKNLTKNIANNFIFKEYKNMQHDWFLFPLPESKKVLNEICEIIKFEN